MSSHSAYDENGRLQEPFSTFTDMPIWECNEYCGCDLSACPNRVVQRGRTVGLDIFKTKEKGWGVRTIDAVPKVSFLFICRAHEEAARAAARGVRRGRAEQQRDACAAERTSSGERRAQ